MNSVLDRATPASEPPAEASVKTAKYITFKVAGYVFALSSQEILKVVATPSPNEGGMVSMGLVQLEQYSIQILNLPELLRLNTTDRQSSAENPPFLMVLQNAEKDLWGIAVDHPPDLLEVPDYALKPVPPEKRLTPALRWVSHVVTYSLGSDRHTLLLLDSSLLLAPPQDESETTSSFEIQPPADSETTGSFEIQPPLEPEGENGL